MRSDDPDRRHGDGHGGDHAHRAPAARQEQQQREREVQLGLDGHRPERAIGTRCAHEILYQQAVDGDRPKPGHPLARLGNHEPGHRQAEGERRPVRRQDPPGPAAREVQDPVEPPAAAGWRQREGEPGEDDEHHDGETPIDEPGRPERCVVHGIAGERAQEYVVDDDEQRGQAPDAVRAGDSLPGKGGACGYRTHDVYRVVVCESNAVRKRLRKAFIGHTGAVGLGCRPGPQPQLPICFSTLGSWAMIEIGTT